VHAITEKSKKMSSVKVVVVFMILKILSLSPPTQESCQIIPNAPSYYQ
jgi:hypothetical protein